MKKEIYNKAELEMIKLSATDVLAGSGDLGSDDDDELPFVPAK